MSATSTPSSAGSSEIDEDFQSRQLAVYGRKAMGKLRSCHVLISGINGLGAEIAKNVVLANVASVTLHDAAAVSAADLGAHFYLKPEDVGKNRALASQARFQELNPGVKVNVIEGELTLEHLPSFTVVVLVGARRDFAVAANEVCHKNTPKPIAFIWTDAVGLAARIFCDFGDEFIVLDPDDKPIRSAIVSNILKDGHVTCIEGERVELREDDMVVFTEVEGMVELNDGKPRRVTNVTDVSFDIAGGVEGFSEYTRGGIATQVKVPVTLNFRTLADALEDPGEIQSTDDAKMIRPPLMHVLFGALDEFVAEKGHLPRPANDEDAAAVLEKVKAKESSGTFMMEEEVVTNIAKCAQAVLNPMAALIGGVVGQEVIKAATGKFTPVHQFVYFDSLECLADEQPAAEERQPTGSRYDAQTIVFGKSFQEKLSKLNVFVVGSGALGCEFLKNMSMMGIASAGGRVTVTDDDTIEKSNLSRQFLFRNWHIGAGKSEVAAEEAKAMNEDFNIVPLKDRVSTRTEDVFNDEFWSGLDVVVNALDNVKARKYVDSRCVFFLKPLLESGTLGPSCSTMVCLPHKTENYGAQPDPPEKSTPDCTLHNFPHNIQHCLSWARSDFVGKFESGPEALAEYLEKGEKYLEHLREAKMTTNEISERLDKIESLVKDPPRSFEDCIRVARLNFEELFANKIKQLTFTFPEDAKTDSGLPFWAPPKRFPTPLDFDRNDGEHLRFVISNANLLARLYGIVPPETPKSAEARAQAMAPEDSPPENRDVEYFQEVLDTIEVPEFVPRKGVRIKVDEKDNTKPTVGSSEVERRFERLARPEALPFAKVFPEEFEKDHDWNFHMDYVGSVGNLRARCYRLNEVDKLEAKLTAGRIIPAIATATACATGLVMLEFYKIVNQKNVGTWRDVGAYRNAYYNLSMPEFKMSDTVAPAKVESRQVKVYPDPIRHPDYFEEEDVVAIPNPHTVWDRIDVKLDNPTIQQVIDYFKAEYGVEVLSVTISTPEGKAPLLFHSAMKGTHKRLNDPIVEAFERMGRVKVTKSYVLPDLYCTKDGDDVDFPTIVLHYR